MKQLEKIQCSYSKIPFKTSLSFEYLIAEIERISEDENHIMNWQARNILSDLEKVPDLRSVIDDFNLVKENRNLVNKLMKFIFNPMDDDTEISVAAVPFFPKSFYSTSLYSKNFRGDHKKIEPTNNFGNNDIVAIIYLAYQIILNEFFNFSFDMNVPYTFKLFNNETNSARYFKALINTKYVDIKAHGKVKKLSKEELKLLFDNSHNLDYWNEIIPLNKFEFTGFLKLTYVDVTHEFVVSELKTLMLDKDAILLDENFEQVKDKIRALIEIPDLEIGLAAFSDFNSSINQNMIWKSIIPRSELSCEEYENTVYQTGYMDRKIVLTKDIQKVEQNKMTRLFAERGIKSHVVIPLQIEDEIVGMMELGAKNTGQINMFQVKRLYELFPVFALALKRSINELNDRIRAIIQEEFTAIHPTVEWKFKEIANSICNDRTTGNRLPIEPIIFNDVVPIYGASDIRGSSIERNSAIQADLTEHLNIAKNILDYCMENIEMPLIDHLSYKIEQHLETVKAGLKAGDEVSIIDFLKKEIEPVFKQLKNRDIVNNNIFKDYFQKMDPELKVLYKKRKNFEDSLTKINDIVGEIIEKEQVKAQLIYPHYFEKYRTDGIEYNAYIGQSLVKDIPYNNIYLKNIRLWQLLVKIRIARKIHEFVPKLKTKLDITQLILVHSNPLSITFRQDEKKFDVAGAYNIRYEITKKRIDKAKIKDTNERITQVGKIAIIYSHAEEIEEYRKYVDYLISKNYLKNSIEDLELEDLKGALGLRALRVEVDFETSDSQEEIIIEDVKKIIENM